MPKFVCMDCGCRKVRGTGTAVTCVEISEDGKVNTSDIEWEHFEGMQCVECGSDNVLEIGTGVRYRDAI